MAAGGTVWVAIVGVRALVYRDLNPGWPTLIGVLMVGFGVTNISLGIIAEYLWRTFDATRGRKVFVVQQEQALTRAGS